MVLNPKNLFLIDGLGALLSAFLLGSILVRFEHEFGMPRKVLYFLSVTAGIFATYSLISHVFLIKNHAAYLKLIAWANLIYCGLTIGLIVCFHKELTVLGWLYFPGEIVVIIALATIELRTVSNIQQR